MLGELLGEGAMGWILLGSTTYGYHLLGLRGD